MKPTVSDNDTAQPASCSHIERVVVSSVANNWSAARLRALASAANEAVDALALPTARQAAAIERVAKRYARVLDVDARDLTAALHASAAGTAPIKETAAAQQPA